MQNSLRQEYWRSSMGQMRQVLGDQLQFFSICANPSVMKSTEPFLRRMCVIFLKSPVVGRDGKIDIDNKVFPDDFDLMEFLQGSEARLAYTTCFFFPFIRRHNYEDCVHALKNSSQRIKDQTLTVVQQMANGGLRPFTSEL